MMRFARLSAGVLVTQITSILVAAEFDVCSNAVSIYTEHQNDPLADTSAVKFNAALGLESNLVDDYSAWCNLLGCPQFNSNAATWCATDGGSVCINQCAALRDGTHPANGIDNVCTRYGIPNCEHSMMRELSQEPKWECGASLIPRVEDVLHISVLACEASVAALNLAWEFSPDVIYENQGEDDEHWIGVKDLKCWSGKGESHGPVDSDGNFIGPSSFLIVYSNSGVGGAGNPEYPCAQIARHITKATGRMVECADWWGASNILKLKDPADCSHVTYELDKISMSGTLPPAAISTSPSRSPTLAPIPKTTSPTPSSSTSPSRLPTLAPTIPKWECGASLSRGDFLYPRVENVFHMSKSSCEASTAALNNALGYSVSYGSNYLMCRPASDDKSEGPVDTDGNFIGPSSFLIVNSVGCEDAEDRCAEIAGHITKATGRRVECARYGLWSNILKLQFLADCSHVTYELDKISMSGTLPPSPSRSPTLAPIPKTTSPTQVPITGKPTASHMCASPGSNCFIKQKGKGCDDESCMNVICESKAQCCDKKWQKKCANTAIKKCNICSCSEKFDGIFLLKIKKGKVKTKTCKWLKAHKGNSIKKLCKKFSSSGNIRAARFVCPVTCKLCAK